MIKINKDNNLIVGDNILHLSKFPNFVNGHLTRYPTTKYLELEAINLKSTNFNEEQLGKFIRHVCIWGGYAGIGARILSQNPFIYIKNHFINAMKILDTINPDVKKALLEINNIRNLGSPSFASKHLRFLKPDICPILDSIISDKLDYEYDAQGYKCLSDDCLIVADKLQAAGIFNPMERDRGRWFAADVEMAIFSFINNITASKQELIAD